MIHKELSIFQSGSHFRPSLWSSGLSSGIDALRGPNDDGFTTPAQLAKLREILPEMPHRSSFPQKIRLDPAQIANFRGLMSTARLNPAQIAKLREFMPSRCGSHAAPDDWKKELLLATECLTGLGKDDLSDEENSVPLNFRIPTYQTSSTGLEQVDTPTISATKPSTNVVENDIKRSVQTHPNTM